MASTLDTRAMERFNLLAAEPEYDDSDPEGYRAGMDRFGPKIGAAQTRRLGLRAPARAEHLPLPLRVSGRGVADAARRDGGDPRRPRARRSSGRSSVVSRSRPGAAGAHKVHEPRRGDRARADALDEARGVGVRLSRQRQGARELAGGPAHVAAVVRGRLLRRGGVGVEPLRVRDRRSTSPPRRPRRRSTGTSTASTPRSCSSTWSRGGGPSLHRHAYPEVFIVADGEATFTVDGAEHVARGGQTVVVPAGAAHRFQNTGSVTLELTSIQPVAEMKTEWLERRAADPEHVAVGVADVELAHVPRLVGRRGRDLEPCDAALVHASTSSTQIDIHAPRSALIPPAAGRVRPPAAPALAVVAQEDLALARGDRTELDRAVGRRGATRSPSPSRACRTRRRSPRRLHVEDRNDLLDLHAAFQIPNTTPCGSAA